MVGDADADVYAETLTVFAPGGDPLTTTEVGAALDLPRRTAYKRLDVLVDRGDLETKKVGAKARVWWRPLGAADAPGSDAGTDAPAVPAETFRAVFEGAFDAMILADDDGRWVDVNPAACDLFGLPREALLGRSPAEFAAPGYDVEAAWAEFVASDLDRGHFPFVRADGESRVAEFAATPNVRPGRHLSILRDVTERERTVAELARVNHLNTVIRGVERATTHAETTQSLAEAVCHNLLDSDHYRYVALCEAPSDADRMDALAATGDGLVGSLDSAGLPAIDPEVAQRVFDDETVQVQRVPSPDEASTPWLATLAEHGVRSFAVVPVVHDEVERGVIGIASDRSDAFDREERVVLDELGAAVAHGLRMLARHRGLADESLVVTLHSREMATPLAALADTEDASITLDQSLPVPGGVVDYYTLEGFPADSLVGHLDAADIRAEARVLDQVDDVAWLEVTSYDSPSATVATEFGGRLEAVTIADGEAEVVVRVPVGTDVRALPEPFVRFAADITVVAQEHRYRQQSPRRSLLTAFDAQLSDRQRAALELAYHAGYFEWPRHTSGAQLADLLDVHPSTFHYHLRAAERKLLAALLDERDST